MRLACALLVLLLAAASAAAQRATAASAPEFAYEYVPVDAIRGHLVQGEFKEPSTLWFDPIARELLVADAKSHLVGIFDPDGIPIFTFGGPARLLEPRCVVVDGDGSIWVVDADRTVVKVFNYRGEPQQRLSFAYPAQDGHPAGVVAVGSVALAPNGSILVSDLELPQVAIYDRELNLKKLIRPVDGGAQFQVITDLAVAEDGTLAVTDFKATPVQLFDAEGRFQLGFGKRDVGREDFTAPIAVTFDGDGHLLVVDMLRHEVKVFDRAGNYLSYFGGWFTPETGGRSPGELLYPSDIAIDPSGFVYVAEKVGKRVQIFRRVPSNQSGPQLRLPDVPPLKDGARSGSR